MDLPTWWHNRQYALLDALVASVLLGLLGLLVRYLWRRWTGDRTTEEEVREVLREVGALREQVQRLADGLAQRPDEMKPSDAPIPAGLSPADRAVVQAATTDLQVAPELIKQAKLNEAETVVTARRDSLLAVWRRVATTASPEARARLAVLLARAYIQLGTIAFERVKYREAADIYRQAVTWAEQGHDAETLRLAKYQVGVALSYGRYFREALPYFETSPAPETPEQRAARLHNLAVCQDELGLKQEALAAYDEALAIRRDLAAREPAAFNPYVAGTLNNRGNVLAELGRREEALAAYDEALAIRRDLAAREPAAFSPDVAMTLNNRGNVLAALGRREEALADFDEALAIRRDLAAQEPAAFSPGVAMTLNNRGNVLAELGRREEALADFDEAIAIYEPLVRRWPEAYQLKMEAVRHYRQQLLGNQH